MPPHAGVRDRLEVDDQIEIGCRQAQLLMTVPAKTYVTNFESAIAH
jgi:hypothetical protein